MSVIDEVFSIELKNFRRLSAFDIFNTKPPSLKGHSRFYSRDFVPFAAERDVRGKLIKQPRQSQENFRHSALWYLSQNINSDQSKDNTQAFKTRKTLVDARFKLHQVNHFKETNAKSHKKILPQFTRDLQFLQNKDYERKQKQAKLEEELLMTNGFKSIEFPVSKNHENSEPTQSENVFNLTLKSQNSEKLNKKFKHQSVSMMNLKKLKPAFNMSTIHSSSKSLFNKKPNRNPELHEIQKQVKVHFNHPELDRLKQFKKLQFKIVENLEVGDQKFKDKVEQYKTIKERIKKEMVKY